MSKLDHVFVPDHHSGATCAFRLIGTGGPFCGRPESEHGGPVLSLYDVYGERELLGLVVCCPSGISWSNQAGGTGCQHPRAEGVFVALDPPISPEAPWPHLCTSWDDDLLPSEVQAAIDASRLPLRVDPERWAESMEAWWPVVVDARRSGLLPQYHALGQLDGWKGYLVTENCD